MGRKPNTIISEFFHRGQKLADSSNRYEHTCRLCGERFPKGRTDTLLSHITKTCQAISTADKDRVVHLTNAASNGGSDKAPKKTQTGRATNHRRIVDPAYRPSASNFQSSGGLNGLNVLAEASRRVGASSDGHAQDCTSETAPADKTVMVDPALESVAKLADDTDFHTTFNPPSSPPTQLFSSAETNSAVHIPPTNPLLAAVSAPDERQTSQLSLIAASANEIVTEDAGNPLEPAANDTTLDSGPHVVAQARSNSEFRPLAINPHLQNNELYCDLDDASNAGKKKPRSNFSEERREEVRVVRKMGACLRCRMLKKTCSAGTPCAQCRNLQNPRVWMECCIRARLMNQLEAYSVGLHSTLAYHDIRNMKNQMHFEHSAGRIEVMHFESETFHFLTFGALYGQRRTMNALNPRLPNSASDADLSESLDYVYILDGEIDELSAKLDVYMRKRTRQFLEAEQSSFIRETLLLASELGDQHQDEMLNSALELWVATSLLVDPFLNWTVYLNPTLPPTTLQPLTSNSNESRIPINNNDEVESYSLICAQLRSAAEKRAAKICKVVLNKYEQRLLQRQRSGSFRTFLATIILLNCVERMEWLFRSWDSEQYIQRWPLERRPAYFAIQIKKFAEIVATHLKMRSLAPAFVTTPHYGIMKAKDGSEDDACRWFDTVGTSYHHLQTRQFAEFDVNDSRSIDLKYSSAVVLSAEFTSD